MVYISERFRLILVSIINDIFLTEYVDFYMCVSIVMGMFLCIFQTLSEGYSRVRS